MRALAIALIVSVASIQSSPQSLLAQHTSAPVDLPSDARAILQARGEGVQIYTCTVATGAVAASTAKWVFTAPDAKLFDASGKAIGTHFAGPTWKLNDHSQIPSQIPSQVQGELISSQPAPEANSIPWLFLRAKAGTGSGKFADVAFILRTETHGGVQPQSGCETMQDAGKTARVPYTATYTFYAETPAR